MRKQWVLKLVMFTLILVGEALLIICCSPDKAYAWGDSAGGRTTYILDEVDEDTFGEKIVFNSIRDSVIGDERNFVSALKSTNHIKNVWNVNTINVENDTEYIIRIYVNNNNFYSSNAIAENTRVALSIPDISGKEIRVNGYIFSSNAEPQRYWDYIDFIGDHKFHLQYIYGSACLQNNGIGSGSGIRLSDEIVTAASEGGVLIGYDALDGKIPGGYAHDNFVSIRVKAVYDYDIVPQEEIDEVSRKEIIERGKGMVKILSDYKTMFTMSKIVCNSALIISILGIFISFFKDSYMRNKEIQEKGQEKGAQRKVRKKSIRMCIFCFIMAIALGVLNISGTFNQEKIDINDTETYFGQVKNDQAYGRGRIYNKDENLVYSGYFKNNQYDGKGKLFALVSIGGKNETVLEYEGEFKNGKKDGEGKLYYISGSNIGKIRYEGEFSNDLYNGRGKIYYEEGGIYEGCFAEGKRHGYGKWVYQTGDNDEIVVYGTFSGDKLNGYAERYLNGQLEFKGQFSYGTAFGDGISYYENGNVKYEGCFADGKYNGYGILYSESDGTILKEGVWNMGIFKY